MSSGYNHSSFEGESDRAFILRKIVSYGRGTKFNGRRLIQDIQAERNVSDRAVLGVLKRYNGTVVEGHRSDNTRLMEWTVLVGD